MDLSAKIIKLPSGPITADAHARAGKPFTYALPIEQHDSSALRRQNHQRNALFNKFFRLVRNYYARQYFENMVEARPCNNYNTINNVYLNIRNFIDNISDYNNINDIDFTLPEMDHLFLQDYNIYDTEGGYDVSNSDAAAADANNSDDSDANILIAHEVLEDSDNEDFGNLEAEVRARWYRNVAEMIVSDINDDSDEISMLPPPPAENRQNRRRNNRRSRSSRNTPY
ncbi:hypothetical protein [Orgyia pseudotsugata single capsid nuclopolyhedrovirus]|nr:hypothetical protein [Orgyia pseudotsugata single capsid nuclopolyhedrovirus]